MLFSFEEYSGLPFEKSSQHELKAFKVRPNHKKKKISTNSNHTLFISHIKFRDHKYVLKIEMWTSPPSSRRLK